LAFDATPCPHTAFDKADQESNLVALYRDLAASGRYLFGSREMQSALGVSAAAKPALNRLAKQKVIASPARGFYVIVPPEYRSAVFLPSSLSRL